MPSGRTHDRITLWSLPLVVGLAVAIARNSTFVLLICGGFLFGGLMLGPDLDIHSIHFKRWGWFRWIWIPYRGSMRHRSPLSHAPIVGTVLRVIYLGVWVGLASLVALAMLNQIGQLGWTWEQIAQLVGRSLQQHRVEWLILALGLELGALSHYIADWGVSTYKRCRTKGWKGLAPAQSTSRKRRTTRRPKKRALSIAKSSAASPKRRSKS
jgi:uncharacterized metal-binding protein